MFVAFAMEGLGGSDEVVVTLLTVAVVVTVVVVTVLYTVVWPRLCCNIAVIADGRTGPCGLLGGS